MSPRPDEHAPPIVQALDIAFRYLRWVALVLVVAYLATGIRTVHSDMQAIVLTFGKVTRVQTSGLLVAWPYPIDNVVPVSTREAKRLEVEGLWKPLPGAEGENVDPLSPRYIFAMELIPDTIDPTQEGYCITGDHDILQTRVALTYRIDGAENYALGIADRRDAKTPGDQLIDNRTELLQSLVMAAATRAVGQVSGGDFAEKTGAIRQEILLDVQSRLDRIQSGIAVEDVQLLIHPPRHVMREYQAVTFARIKAMGDKAVVESERVRETGHAVAEAQKVVGAARDANSQVIESAKGRAQAFRDLLAQYRKDPVSVSSRLWTEAVEEIMSRARVRVVSAPGAKIRIIVEPDEYLEVPR